MSRPKGSKNKNTSELPAYTALSTAERIDLLANLIVDKIIEDQRNGGELIRHLGQGYAGSSNTWKRRSRHPRLYH